MLLDWCFLGTEVALIGVRERFPDAPVASNRTVGLTSLF